MIRDELLKDYFPALKVFKAYCCIRPCSQMDNEGVCRQITLVEQAKLTTGMPVLGLASGYPSHNHQAEVSRC